MTDEIEITNRGRAVVESGLSLRQAHEQLTGCTEANPCVKCLVDYQMANQPPAGYTCPDCGTSWTAPVEHCDCRDE